MSVTAASLSLITQVSVLLSLVEQIASATAPLSAPAATLEPSSAPDSKAPTPLDSNEKLAEATPIASIARLDDPSTARTAAQRRLIRRMRIQIFVGAGIGLGIALASAFRAL